MAQKIVGVDLGAHHVKVAVVSAGIRGVQLVDAFEEPVGHVPPSGGDGEEEVDPLGMVLGVALSALRRKRLLGNPLAIVLPPGLLSYRVLSFPFSDERRIAQAVAFEAEGQFPVPLEQLVYGHVVVPTPGGGGRALVVAARAERVSQIAAVFRQAGADVKLVTSGAVAAAQIAKPSLAALSPEGDEAGLKPASLVVDFGHTTTQMIALGAKGPVAVRTLRRGGRNLTAAMARAYSLDFDAAQASKHSDGFVPHRGFDSISSDQLESGRVVAEALEPVIRELEHTRLWLKSTFNLEVGKILTAGGGADLQGIDEYLAEHIELPVERLAPRPNLIKGTEGRQWSSLGSALGAAYGAARRPLVQLHEGAGEAADSSWVQERMTSLIAIGVAVMAFAALDTIAQVNALAAEQAAYEEELEAATIAAFDEPLMTTAKIDAKLASVRGADLTSLVPERGALEILAMVVDAATPSDLADQPALDAAAVLPPGMPPLSPDGIDLLNLPVNPSAFRGMPGAPDVPDAPGATDDPVEFAPVAPDAGIVIADDFIVESIDIRPQTSAGSTGAIDLRASARVSSAQERLNTKLKRKMDCVVSVTNGKAKSTSDKKQFDMAIAHNCNYQQPAADADAADEDDAD